jgi:hypothetical protein
MTADHDLFTRMLFVDAIVGVECGITILYRSAPRGAGTGEHPNPLIDTKFDRDGPLYSWNRTALEALATPTLQELYTALKLHEVTHAG